MSKLFSLETELDVTLVSAKNLKAADIGGILFSFFILFFYFYHHIFTFFTIYSSYILILRTFTQHHFEVLTSIFLAPLVTFLSFFLLFRVGKSDPYVVLYTGSDNSMDDVVNQKSPVIQKELNPVV